VSIAVIPLLAGSEDTCHPLDQGLKITIKNLFELKIVGDSYVWISSTAAA
jgi:hypothetical protein